jgi:hypothetical protein
LRQFEPSGEKIDDDMLARWPLPAADPQTNPVMSQ